MTEYERDDAYTALAEGILRTRFLDCPDDGSVRQDVLDECIQRFLAYELPPEKTGKLTPDQLVMLFEKYYEFERMKFALG